MIDDRAAIGGWRRWLLALVIALCAGLTAGACGGFSAVSSSDPPPGFNIGLGMAAGLPAATMAALVGGWLLRRAGRREMRLWAIVGVGGYAMVLFCIWHDDGGAGYPCGIWAALTPLVGGLAAIAAGHIGFSRAERRPDPGVGILVGAGVSMAILAAVIAWLMAWILPELIPLLPWGHTRQRYASMVVKGALAGSWPLLVAAVAAGLGAFMLRANWEPDMAKLPPS